MTDIFVTFIISVTAGIVCYYICKWLDRDDGNDNRPRE